MTTQFTNERKKRFYIISFIILPIIFIAGYYVSMEIAQLFNFTVDGRGSLFVAFILFILYLKSIHTAYNALSNKRE